MLLLRNPFETATEVHAMDDNFSGGAKVRFRWEALRIGALKVEGKNMNDGTIV